MAPGITMGLTLFQGQRMAQEQELQCTLSLRQELADPFEYARELFASSDKVSIPIKVGKYTVRVQAAIVSEFELGVLFEQEKFAGIIARLGEQYQFLNREIRAPEAVHGMMPKLMAFHCLASIRVPSFVDGTGTLSQYQAIALELAYAKAIAGMVEYAAYEAWRPGVERTDFFRRQDWREIAGRVHARFREISEELHVNAYEAKFLVTGKSEKMVRTPNGAMNFMGEELPVHRSTCRRRVPAR